jgi:hypothetical protein
MDREAQHRWAEKANFSIYGFLPEGNVKFSDLFLMDNALVCTEWIINFGINSEAAVRVFTQLGIILGNDHPNTKQVKSNYEKLLITKEKSLYG